MQKRLIFPIILLFILMPISTMTEASSNLESSEEPLETNSHLSINIVQYAPYVSNSSIQICVFMDYIDCATVEIFESSTTEINHSSIFLVNNFSQEFEITLESESEDGIVDLTPDNSTTKLTIYCFINHCSNQSISTLGEFDNEQNQTYTQLEVTLSIGDFGDKDFDSILNFEDNCPNTSTNQTVDVYGCSWDQSDYDKDGLKNGNDPCPSLSSIEVCDLKHAYVPTHIIFNEHISVSPNGDMFVLDDHNRRLRGNNDLFFFNVETSVVITTPWPNGQTVIGESGDNRYAGPGLGFVSQLDTLRNDKYRASFSPDGKYFRFESELEINPFVVETSTFEPVEFRQSIHSFENFIDPNLIIDIRFESFEHYSSSYSNHFTSAHVLRSYPGIATLNHSEESVVYIEPSSKITSLSMSDAKNSAVVLEKDTQTSSFNFSLYIYDFATGNKSIIDLPNPMRTHPTWGNFLTDINDIHSVETSLDGSIILVETTRELGSLGATKVTQIFERDTDNDGYADSQDDYPLDYSKWTDKSSDSSELSFLQAIGYCLGLMIVLPLVGVVISKEFGASDLSSIKLPSIQVGGFFQNLILLLSIPIAVALAPFLACFVFLYLVVSIFVGTD